MRCEWQIVEGAGRHPVFRCRLCKREETVIGDPSELLARSRECTGLPESSPPAFRLRGRVHGYLSALKRMAH